MPYTKSGVALRPSIIAWPAGVLESAKGESDRDAGDNEEEDSGNSDA